MPRKVQLVIVCEDLLQQTFARAFLKQLGFHHRQLTFPPVRPGAGDAKQRVLQNTCRELQALRRFAGRGRGLVFVIDADNLSVVQRRARLDQACQDAGVAPPRQDEAVFAVIPKWEIENWLAYLRGETVDEQSNQYEKYRGRESAVYPLAERLSQMCDRQELPDAPPSLMTACKEYDRFRDWRRED